MKVIVVRILGGLGNQLFCYSAARRLAMINNAELVIDNVSGFKFDKLYKRHYQLDHFKIQARKSTSAERLEPLSRFRRLVKRKWNQLLPFDDRAYISQEGIDYDSRLVELKLARSLYMEGYWQSEKYFKDIEDTIRQDLQIIPPSDADNLNMVQQINSCMSIAVHVRFFDNLRSNFSNNNVLDDYYAKAIDKMESMNLNAHYFIFSDIPDLARLKIPLPDSRLTLVAHNNYSEKNAYADLWLMTQCKKFIIANSTFSWWGAWLANNPNKQVIAPGIEIRHGNMWWGFNGLLPAEWIKL